MNARHVCAFTLCVALAALGMVAPAADAATINVPADYTTVQSAVDAAAAGDTVQIAAGTYNENVTVAKAITVTGEDPSSTCINGSGSGNVVTVTASGVTLRDLCLENGGTAAPCAGIRFNGVSGCLIDGCEAYGSSRGVSFSSSSGNEIRSSVVGDNTEYGIDLGDTGSANNTVLDCEAYGSSYTGIIAYAGSNNLQVLDCYSHDNGGNGFAIGWSSGWLIQDCVSEANAGGINVDTASGGTIDGCTLRMNSNAGIGFGGWGSTGNTISNNMIAGNANYGVILSCSAKSNTFTGNWIEQNAIGVFVTLNTASRNYDNLFCGNRFIDNTTQVRVDETTSANYFDNGYPTGGNYWSDYTGADLYGGAAQDVLGADGIGDTPITLCAVASDDYPLMLWDTVPPDVAVVSGPAEGWTTATSATFEWAGSDDVTAEGDLKYRFRLDSGSWSDWDSGTTTSFSSLADGLHVFDVAAQDDAGNVTTPPESVTFGVDTTAPVTTDDADGIWHNTDVTVTLTATDSGSGMSGGLAGTKYNIDGTGWVSGAVVTISALADHSADGVHTISYCSEDAVGNTEAVKICTVRIDTVAPTTADNAPSGWKNRSVTVQFSPTDVHSGMSGGSAKTEYRIDTGTWTTGTQATVTADFRRHLTDGVHTVYYQSTDAAGNTEVAKSCTVRIDTRKPTPLAPASASVLRNRVVSLPYRVNDLAPNGGTAKVTIKIRRAGDGGLVKTINCGWKPVNSLRMVSFRCTLAVNSYRFYVYATDTAGNPQSTVPWNTLTVL